MKIKKINGHSLYGELNFKWEFDSQVNILAGINGSYKTTLLNIIKQVTNHEDVAYPTPEVRFLVVFRKQDSPSSRTRFLPGSIKTLLDKLISK